ncbi:T9SS type A sorting domain-containing protein [Hymenobacter sp. BT175]|uniref:T9SS type A sorting domain-containing protein n=1 Tax=Hymenobacter translucens TaxID=2886507 RepID=UPI001D0EA606|nr:T9SS type A sorting domain-containing protein [Hymenobacter translucens]MCC2547976.1 T9SS type A sorting domain-containing protein [Hymenobacter translucens]
MKHLYPFLIVCACLLGVSAQAQNWRPFRPNGDVHAFRGVSADTVLTLRLDSAAVIGADSVYFFNRIMRRQGSFQWRKSVNNQFGRVMRYNVAQRTYSLHWDGGPSTGFNLDRVLVLKPFASVGSAWMSVNTDVAVPTGLLSRGTMLIDGVMDSIVTFQINNATNIILSKNNGLVSAPASLQLSSNPRMLSLARRPSPAGQSYYNPLMLLDLQVGDELGYYQEPIMQNPFACYQGWLLRHVLSRQVTADSVVYMLQQQSRMVTSGAPGCGGSSTTISPVSVVRVAASRKTGRWAGAGFGGAPMLPVNTDLLTYEYKMRLSGLNSLMMGHPVVPARPGRACGGPAALWQEMLYASSGTPQNYAPGIDALAWGQLVAEGVGPVAQYEHRLTYSRRTVNGTVQTCGSRTGFGLLPTKAALAARFQLYPNPAAATATLMLPEPARTVTTIRLLDGLGRVAVTQQLMAGQASTVLQLQSLAAGSYVVEVQAAGEVTQRLRLQHQQ